MGFIRKSELLRVMYNHGFIVGSVLCIAVGDGRKELEAVVSAYLVAGQWAWQSGRKLGLRQAEQRQTGV